MFADNSQTPGLVPVLPAMGLVEARDPGFANPERQATMSELVPYFLGYGKVERNWSDTTLRTYGNSLRWIIRIIGDLPPQRIRLEHVLRVKGRLRTARSRQPPYGNRGSGSQVILAFLPIERRVRDHGRAADSLPAHTQDRGPLPHPGRSAAVRRRNSDPQKSARI